MLWCAADQNLHRRTDHPLCIIKEEIYRYMETTAPGVYRTFDDLYPIVTARVCSFGLNTSRHAVAGTYWPVGH